MWNAQKTHTLCNLLKPLFFKKLNKIHIVALKGFWCYILTLEFRPYFCPFLKVVKYECNQVCLFFRSTNFKITCILSTVRICTLHAHMYSTSTNFFTCTSIEIVWIWRIYSIKWKGCKGGLISKTFAILIKRFQITALNFSI